LLIDKLRPPRQLRIHQPLSLNRSLCSSAAWPSPFYVGSFILVLSPGLPLPLSIQMPQPAPVVVIALNLNNLSRLCVGSNQMHSPFSHSSVP